MSFGMPTIRPRADEADVTTSQLFDDVGATSGFDGATGADLKIHAVAQTLTTGIPATLARPSGTVHPLESSEGRWNEHQDKIRMTVLRNTQGLHAPFRLLMERKAASQVCRLPFLPSHHVALDVLTGNDECVGFEDFLGGQEVGSEVMGNPHALVEKRMGIL